MSRLEWQKEITTGAIAIGLCGYLAAKIDSKLYTAERKREFREISENTYFESEEVAKIFCAYELSQETIALIVTAIHTELVISLK